MPFRANPDTAPVEGLPKVLEVSPTGFAKIPYFLPLTLSSDDILAPGIVEDDYGKRTFSVSLPALPAQLLAEETDRVMAHVKKYWTNVDIKLPDLNKFKVTVPKMKKGIPVNGDTYLTALTDLNEALSEGHSYEIEYRLWVMKDTKDTGGSGKLIGGFFAMLHKIST